MTTRRVFRYGVRDHPIGTIVRSPGDHFLRLTPAQKTVELAMRAVSPVRGDIRTTSLYTWENQAVADRLWSRNHAAGRAAHLFELEIEQSDIRHIGDVNYFTEALEALAKNQPLDPAVAQYWQGNRAGPPYTEPRIEILVWKAQVISKLRP